MPWSATDAARHTRMADTPARRRMWAEIANQELSNHGDDGRAIRAANAAVHRNYRGKDTATKD